MWASTSSWGPDLGKQILSQGIQPIELRLVCIYFEQITDSWIKIWAIMGILCVPLKKIAIPYVPLEKFSGLQRHCSNFFMPSMPLPSVWALTPSNCRCEKTKIPLNLNMSLIFFEHLNGFKWKNSKLESCRSRRDL